MLGLVLFHSDFLFYFILFFLFFFFFFFFFSFYYFLFFCFLHVSLNRSFILRRMQSLFKTLNWSKSPIVKVIRPQAPAFIAGDVYLRHVPQVDLRMTN